jgi:dipeptidyl aminopeptidase/acylaminoacyl peptidase
MPVPAACAFIAALFLVSLTFAADVRRPLAVQDINAPIEVGDPQLSADGEWIAYTVGHADTQKDESITHVWMASWNGEHNVQLTYSDGSEHTPRWSPDGKHLAFISARGKENEPEQLWLLDRLGGDARPLTSFKGDVVDYDWSPNGKRLALIVMDEDPQREAEKDKDKTAPPIVIDRFYFKEDETGYLGALRQHLYLFDIATRKAEIMTPGRFSEWLPTWSPDGEQIAFVSKRTGDPDRTDENGLYVIPARSGGEPRLLANFHGDVGPSGWLTRPSWRPDGREIAITAANDPKLVYYATQQLRVVPVSGGPFRVVASDLDRNVLSPSWSADGKWIFGIIEDDRNQHLARFRASDGKVERVLTGRREISAFDHGRKNRIVVLESTIDRPNEIFVIEGTQPSRLTRHNDAWLNVVQLASVEEISFASKDGTQIHGFIVKPPDFVSGKRYPTLLQIHGGPTSQYANTFMPMWQIMAAQGYIVVAANPRGSSGRGGEFAKAIFADWGGKDTHDVLAAVDYAVDRGIANPNRLGVGGWSYGGILTNNVIARDTRFKAATSGASMGNALAGYGTDMYIISYEAEIGTPWRNLDAYLRNSFPLVHADRIKTPTLFLCGERDFNVPLLNSEQMYQALRSLNIDTQLIIYPEEFHSLTKPSYLQDRLQRYLDWYAKYLKDGAAERNSE